MAKLAIKGHATRDNEVIRILEMMGGNNANNCCGKYCDRAYYINENGYINQDFTAHIERNAKFIIFSLEEFLEKFPYKVGDRVLYKIYGIYSKIKSMLWNVEKEQVFYRLCSNKLFVATADELKSRKEETMEEINIDRIGFNGNKAKLILPDGYEFKTEGKDAYIIKKKPQYPKTYEECCEAIGINRYDIEIDLPQTYQQKMFNLFKLLICRDAYWKIAGEQMGLGKDWDSRYGCGEWGYWIGYSVIENKIDLQDSRILVNHILVFPTAEMRDTFYKNFKDLIEQVKELL